MISGVFQRSPGIYLTAEEKSRKPQLGDTVDQSSGTSRRLQRGPLPPNEVGRITQHVRKGEGRNEGRKGRSLLCSKSSKKYALNHVTTGRDTNTPTQNIGIEKTTLT